MKYILWVLVLVVSLAWAKPGMAYEPVTDCVIREFVSDITLATDSSLKIVEDLDVDCGRVPGKHGIFRILPTRVPERLKGEFADTRIELQGITDEDGRPWNYETITDSANHTMTWKVGDGDILISGLNHYRISYTVANAVTLRNEKNQLYWNINGNFWQLLINQVTGRIHFPDGLNKDNTTIGLFTGEFGDATSTMAGWRWVDGQTLEIKSTKELAPQQGITVQADFPVGIVTPYQPTFWEKYGLLVQIGLAGLVVLIAFLWAFGIWLRRGRELPFKHPVTAEFAPPANLGPLEALAFSQALGAADTSKGISATIIDLAVRGWLRIEEQAGGWLSGKDWKLVLLKDELAGLRDYELDILQGLFGGVLTAGDSVLVSAQKNKFYVTTKKVAADVKESFYKRGWLDRTSGSLQSKMILGAMGVLFAIFFLPWITIWILPVGIFVAIILFVFGGLMSRRTEAGAEIYRLIKGFQLYMSRAEKYRMQFFEKENIFEKYLPYAIAFGLTGLWVKAFKQMYGEEFTHSYLPIWYVGSSLGGGMDLDSFQSNLNSLSSQMGSVLSSSPSSSGSGGGGGFSGGGGGGGGGGSW
jgi:uncharacterized membrane protein YgcG